MFFLIIIINVRRRVTIVYISSFRDCYVQHLCTSRTAAMFVVFTDTVIFVCIYSNSLNVTKPLSS